MIKFVSSKLTQCKISIETISEQISEKQNSSLSFALIGNDKNWENALRDILSKKNSPMKFQALAKLMVDVSIKNPDKSIILKITKG